jgi:hypothetical protein
MPINGKSLPREEVRQALNLIDNWEEECCRSHLATLGGGVRRFDDLNIATPTKFNRATLAMQQCIIA